MDEIDAIGGLRFCEGTSADREIQRMLMELLNQLDGFDQLGKILQLQSDYEKEVEKSRVVPCVVKLMRQTNASPLKKTLKKFISWGISRDKGILKENFQASSKVLIISKDSGGHTLATSSIKTRVGQLAKEIVDKSSNSFGVNTENNPKKECKAVMTRSKKFVEADDKESMVYKEQMGEKIGVEVKENDVKGEVNVGKALIDLRANINLTPLSMCKRLGELEIMPTRMALQLAYRSITKPYGVIEDVLMSSRKRKSVGSRPTTQHDTRKFHSFEAWTRYTDNVLGRHVLAERKVEIYHTELDEFKDELERRNFHNRLTNLADSSIDLALVKEFYANLYSPEGPSPKSQNTGPLDKD
eukprot:XP_014619066.1 uncharacterized protein LOC106795046 [Glycine max]